MKTHRSSLAAGLLVTLLAAAGPAAAQLPFEYAVKVVCGRTDGSSTVPGTFATAVNIHNPSTQETRFQFKVAAAAPLSSGAISPFRPVGMQPDGAVTITCREITAMVGSSTFVDGFVVIQSAIDLDVQAVYAAANSAGVSTMDVERFTPRRTAQ